MVSGLLTVLICSLPSPAGHHHLDFFLSIKENAILEFLKCESVKEELPLGPLALFISTVRHAVLKRCED